MERKHDLPLGIVLLLLSLTITIKSGATENPVYFDRTSQCENRSVDSSLPFTVSSDQAWCLVTAFPNEGYYKLSVSNNGTDVATHKRTAIVTLSSDGSPDVFTTIIQEGIAPVITVKEQNILIEPDANEFSLTIASNTDITFLLPDWINEKDGNAWTNGFKTYSFVVSTNQAAQGNVVVKATDPAFDVQVTLSVAKQESMPVIAMQYNARVQTNDDQGNNWPNRKNTVAQFIRAMNVDIMGTQELSKNLLGANQYNDLLELLSTDYSGYVGYREESSLSDEGNAVFFKKDRFTLVASGKFWLSATPDVKSKGWDAGYHRIAVWVVLKEKASGKELFVLNTHFDNTGVTARTQSAELIVEKIEALSGGRPVILTGDLNATPAATPIDRLKTRLDHSKDIALTTGGPAYTLHDYNENPPAGIFIDYVFTSKKIGRINAHTVSEPKYNGVFLSDHCAVTVNMDIYFN